MGYQIQRSNTAEPLRFLLVLSSDHITGATGKTPTVTIAKSSGSGFVTPQGTVTELGSGWYSLSPNAVDANTLGPLLLHATATACDPTDESYDVVTYNPTSFVPGNLPTGPQAINAASLINGAFEIIGVKSQGSTLTAADMQQGLRRLNQIVQQWTIQPLTSVVTEREVFDLEAGKGGPDDPYTIGIGGDFDTDRPASGDFGVSLRVQTADEPFELVRPVYTIDAYQAIACKDLTSSYFQGAYYNPTYVSGFGSIFLYPVPTIAYQIVLYLPKDIQQFGTLTASYDLPPGAHDALEYELARRLATPYGRPWTPDLKKDCEDYIALFKRNNTKMQDLGMDSGLTQRGSGVYNALSDSFN